MPGYVVLYKYTQQGLANIKGMPDMTKRRKEAAEKLGIRVVGVWHLMGEYDAMSVVEAPDDQTLATALLAGGAQGYLTTQTMRALSEEEFAQLVSKLP
jgi:uncharacterized protein with GYD domain